MINSYTAAKSQDWQETQRDKFLEVNFYFRTENFSKQYTEM